MPKLNLEQLTAKWYAKLAKSGFDDIERDNGTLKRWDSTAFYDRYDSTTAAMKTEYYRLAGQFLYEYQFENSVDKEIWKLHSEGLTYPKISAAVKNLRMPQGRGVGRDAINRTIVKLRTIMYKLYEVNYEQV